MEAHGDGMRGEVRDVGARESIGESQLADNRPFFWYFDILNFFIWPYSELVREIRQGDF